ncbi:MAG: hypothetical protein NZT92_09495 [Abditibacteriales bacterium]|nr:hypothetical protein [Abditibacteriales bacterium]MDW8366238.1 cytochrome c3 family protein [Abditibacteriales bacterium]
MNPVHLPEGIECSTCHGDGLAHALRPRVKGLITKFPDAQLCRQCHTPTQTPHFHYQKFVARIKHGPHTHQFKPHHVSR